MNRFGIRSFIKNKLSKPNKNAIFLFGLNKSGTTVIINLLSEATGLSFSHDSYFLQEKFFSDVRNENISFSKYVDKYSEPFSKEIVRYPIDPTYVKFVWDYFNNNKYIVTIRNPFDNIRSILNRLGIPGDLSEIKTEELNLHPNWKRMLNSSENYISSLSDKWVQAYGQENLINNDNCIISKYEDFVENKEEHINKLTFKLGLKSIHSIKNSVNKQYQTKGNSDIDLRDFYGEKNFEIIKKKVYSLMKHYEYKI